MSSVSRRQWLRVAPALSTLPIFAAATPTSAQGGSWRERKKKITIHGLQMAYYEAGTGDPIVFRDGGAGSSRRVQEDDRGARAQGVTNHKIGKQP